MTINNAHAETEEKDKAVKETFYQRLEQVLERAPTNDVKVVLSDFNAKIGREHEYKRVTGCQSLHRESNDNGRRLINFAISGDMVVSSTCFPRRDIYKWTWRSPDGRTHNQIDHVLISKRNASSILNVRTYRGADCDSDHFLVCMRYRDRTMSKERSSGQKAKRLHMEKLKIPETSIDYQNKIKKALNRCNRETCNTGSATGSTMEGNWKIIKETIINTGEEVLGPRPRRLRNEWFDQECVEKIEARNKTRKNYLDRPTRGRREEYERARSEAKGVIRSKKRAP